mgnify:CR=1 FL=1
MIISQICFVWPYGLCGSIGVLSGMGIVSGAPYTVADEEYTRRFVSCLSMAVSKLSVPPTFTLK